MSDFFSCTSSVVKEYLHSVLMIDDQAGMGEPRNVVPRLSTVIPPTASVSKSLGNQLFGKPDEKEQDLKVTSTDLKEDRTLRTDPFEGVSAETHLFDAQQATSSFYDQGIVAGLYKPVIGDNTTSQEFALTVKEPALKSDVIIVDWMLRESAPEYSMELIKTIIKNDSEKGGRLRVIIVYTGELYLDKKRNELFEFLHNDEHIEVEVHGDYEIRSKNLVIAFYNKPGVANENGRAIKSSDLPCVSLKEFSKLVDGIIPSFAIKAAGTIRQNTGRIVSRFGSDLDAAYLSHRVLLPEPEDSEVFMLENFVSYMRNILAIGCVDNQMLGAESIDRWIRKNHADLSRKVEHAGDEYVLGLEELIQVSQHGFGDTLHKILYEKEKTWAGAYKDASRDASLKAISMFDNNRISARESSIELSILSVFRRTYKDVVDVREVPYLTQGTLVYSKSQDKYLLCVTPKCDTVRIDTKKKFSFAVLEEVGGKKFDMVVPMNPFVKMNKVEVCECKQEEIISLIIDDCILNGGKLKDVSLNDDLQKLKNETYDEYSYLSTSSKFYTLEHVVFECDENRRVLGNKIDDNLIEFWDQNLNEYIWIGDLHDLNTISRVGKLITNLNRTGIDELEWLRRQYQ